MGGLYRELKRGAGTRAQCHLVFLPSPDRKTIATTPHRARIRAVFGAFGESATCHQIEDAFEFLLLLLSSGGGQNPGIAIEHDIAGISETQLPRIDFGA